MADDVLDIDGVGVAKAGALRSEGFETVDDVAEATIDELAEVEGFGESKAEDVLEEARSMLGEDGDEDDEGDEEVMEAAVDAVEEEADDEVEEEDEDAGEDDVDEIVSEPTYDVPVEMDYNIGLHVVHVVLEEATSQHQSNNFSLRAEAYSVTEKLMEAIVGNEGESLDVTISLTESELDAFYRAVRSGSLDYNSRAGVTSMYADLNTLKDVIAEKRREAREE